MSDLQNSLDYEDIFNDIMFSIFVSICLTADIFQNFFRIFVVV